jgi:hypothetical protein
VDLVDWREDIPFAAILLGMVASIAGLVRGRFYPAVPAAVGATLFLTVGAMSFGLFPSLIGVLNGGEGKACAILLCMLAAGERCLRKRPGAKLASTVAAVAAILLVLLVGFALFLPYVKGGPAGPAWRQASARLLQVPPPFTLWGCSISHAWAVAASGLLAAIAVAIAGWRIRPCSPIWAGLAEAMAKLVLVVSPLYALARGAASGEPPDFANFLRFRWELTSAIFLLMLIDGLAGVMISLSPSHGALGTGSPKGTTSWSTWSS